MTEQKTINLIDNALRYLWRELLAAGPVLWLLALICRESPPGEYLNAVAVLVIALLVLNPFRLIGRVMAPVTRGALAVVVGMILCAVRLPWLTAYGRACLVALALIIAAAAILTAKTCLLNYSIKQSYEVDRVLAHLTHGTDFLASEAWESYGCRETRAVLHQALNMECPEPLVCSSYKAAYLLGFLHGGRGLDTAAAKLEKANTAIQQLQKEKESLQNRLDWMKREEAERAEKERIEAELCYQVRPAEPAPREPDALEKRDAELLAFLEEGHSCAEAAQVFGLSKSGAHKAAQKARERQRGAA